MRKSDVIADAPGADLETRSRILFHARRTRLWRRNQETCLPARIFVSNHATEFLNHGAKICFHKLHETFFIMLLKRYANSSPSRFFDKALNSAYERHHNSGSHTQQNEPGFVRELISSTTINHLNLASARVYDDSSNMVFFRGGYLHARPYASFMAQAPNGSKICRRELADALVVVYETAPLNPGSAPQVVRRTACMLMFKRDNSVPASTPSYRPKSDPLPQADPKKKYTGDSDKEQFYLFNQWPDFSLEVGRVNNPVQLGTFKSMVLHDIGKFGLVWDGLPMSKWKIDNKPKAWLFADPVPAQTIAAHGNKADGGSLGFLLEQMIDSKPGGGRNFLIATPQTVQGDWNDLMSMLLGYPLASTAAIWDPGYLQKQGNYYGANRNINPSVMQLMPAVGPALDFISKQSADFFAESRIIRTPLEAMREHESRGPNIENYLSTSSISTGIPFTSDAPSNEDASLPILIATVHRHTPFSD